QLCQIELWQRIRFSSGQYSHPPHSLLQRLLTSFQLGQHTSTDHRSRDHILRLLRAQPRNHDALRVLHTWYIGEEDERVRVARCDEFLIDHPAQHHEGNVTSLRIGHAQATNEFTLLAKLLQNAC